MTLIKENTFIPVNKHLIYDNSLSLGARFLMIALVAYIGDHDSLPIDYVWLSVVTNRSKQTIVKYLNELVKRGYVISGEDGYTISQEKINDKV